MQVVHASIGQISDLKGNSEVIRKATKFGGKLALPIEQMDNVQTGNGRVEIRFTAETLPHLKWH
jgi:hypothetical protein